jgi:hypothetical protein
MCISPNRSGPDCVATQIRGSLRIEFSTPPNSIFRRTARALRTQSLNRLTACGCCRVLPASSLVRSRMTFPALGFPWGCTEPNREFCGVSRTSMVSGSVECFADFPELRFWLVRVRTWPRGPTIPCVSLNQCGRLVRLLTPASATAPLGLPNQSSPRL